jgi:hypothetical protein
MRKENIINFLKYLGQVFILILLNYLIGFNYAVLIAFAYLITYGGNK